MAMTKEERRDRERHLRASAALVTQARLKELLTYDPATGVFTRNTSPSRRWKPGDVAGCADPKGYVRIRVDGKYYGAHRLAWLYVHGHHPPNDVDHIDRNPSNNRISNLRLATRSQNMRNKDVLGVYQSKRNKKPTWLVNITVNRKTQYLGSFRDFFEAMCVRKAAENRFFEGFK